MYIWTKRQFVADLARLVDDGRGGGTALIGHTHNELVWCPSHGQPLSPAGYRDLFETIPPRVFGEAGLFADVVRGGPLDLSRVDANDVVDGDMALTIVASQRADVFKAHPLTAAAAPLGQFRVNPLYAAQTDGDRVRFSLQFPSVDYEQEYGACREYLPDTFTLTRAALEAIAAGRLTDDMSDLVRRRVLVDLPRKYY
jgi:hypothetical protein